MQNDRPDYVAARRHDIGPLACVCAITASAIVAMTIGVVTFAHSQDRQFFFEMFAGPRGAATFSRSGMAGPFYEESICYAAGAITLDALNAAYPDKDFMGRCDGGILLTGRQIADRALFLLPPDGASR